MGKSGALLLQYLDDISWRVLDAYAGVVSDLIRRRRGVYALYRKQRLYYVGLASDLMGRLQTHLKDRHKGRWDRFSVYLTAKDEHMKELESLLLRIVNPKGNRQTGRFSRSESLRSALNRMMTSADADKRASIIGGAVAKRRRRRKATRARGVLALAGISEKRTALIGSRRGIKHRASLRTDGTIRFKGRIYKSPSAAARAAVQGPCNGWAFWRFKDESGEWVPLRSLRHR